MKETINILVTGATGFVGQALVNHLLKFHSNQVTSVVRSTKYLHQPNTHVLGDITASTDWSSSLMNQHVVIHMAARAHIMNDEVVDPLAEYRRVNVEGTLNLARQALIAGVKRFIFISSIKVNGEATLPGQAFSASDKPNPQDAYGVSKWEAEQGLLQMADQTELEVVIIRPPLVYGPKVKGNFANLIHWISRGVPLPLGAIDNQRSLVALDNLVDLITTCIEHPAAANQILLAGDGLDLSTTELLRHIATALHKPSRLIKVPPSFLMFGAKLLGQQSIAQRLLGSLQVDISNTRHLLGWEPSVTIEEGLKRCFNETNY